MENNQKMFERRQNEWRDWVRIIGLTIDKSTKVVADLIKENSWNLIEHYIFETIQQKEQLKHFGVNDTPFVALTDDTPYVVLTDTQGKIVFLGHSNDIDLEAKIIELLADNNLSSY